MLNYQCHCQVRQQERLQTICGFCGFFSACQQVPELAYQGNCRWPESSSVNTSISNRLIYSRNQRKKRLTEIVGPALVSNSPCDPRKAGSTLLVWFRNIIFCGVQHSNRKHSNFFQGIVSEVVLLKCILCSFLQHVFIESSLNPGEDVEMHKNKALFYPPRSFASAAGLGPKGFLTRTKKGVNPLSLREEYHLKCLYLHEQQMAFLPLHISHLPPLSPASYGYSRSWRLPMLWELAIWKSNVSLTLQVNY